MPIGVISAFLLLIGCAVVPPRDRPPEDFSSIESLVSELAAEGLCDDFVVKKRVKEFRFGTCWPQGADRDSSDFILLSFFDDEDQYRKNLRWDSTGCNGAMLYGRDWSVGPTQGRELHRLSEIVGGKVVGTAETVDC